jgi:DNA helicase-2/ATP-dependent DNA helicase PcrA
MADLQLNERQQAAVDNPSRALVVVAGAGSGKTEVVARRVERILLESIQEDYRVLAVSYTVKAADELRDRLASRLGDLHRRVEADTVHGYALSLLRQHGTRIGLPLEPEVLARDEDRYELLASWLNEQGGAALPDPASTFRELDLARARRQSAPWLDEWRDALASVGALDFPAMLDRAAELMESPVVRRTLRNVYEHVVVDEAQNLTEAQYHLLTAIIGSPHSKHMNAMVVGDERQSIVGFAGADSTLIDRFTREYEATRIELGTNYRSARKIVDLSRAVATAMGQPQDEVKVEFPATGSVDVRSFPSESSEADGITSWIEGMLQTGLDPATLAPGEPTTIVAEHIAVLGRSAAALGPTKQALDALGVENASASTADAWVTSPPGQAVLEAIAIRSTSNPFASRRRLLSLCGHQPDATWSSLAEVLGRCDNSDIAKLAVLGDVESPGELIAELDAIDIEAPDWSDDVSQLATAWTSFVDRVPVAGRSFAEFRQHIARTQRGDSMDPGVRLLTVHKAQGQEFRCVAVVACNDGQFPDFRASSTDELSAELRTFYVAVSRPARSLLLTRSLNRQTRYGTRSTEPSPFLRFAQGLE